MKELCFKKEALAVAVAVDLDRPAVVAVVQEKHTAHSRQ